MPGGHYVLADLERLDDRIRRVAVADEGINDFRATRVWERVERRYSVFLRHEAEHTAHRGDGRADRGSGGANYVSWRVARCVPRPSAAAVSLRLPVGDVDAHRSAFARGL